MAFDRDYFVSVCAEYGISVTPGTAERFALYYDLLVSWNEKMNLTAITEPHEVAVKHFLDSLLLAKYTEADSTVKLADIGSGAGFPAVPLAIYTGCAVTMVDSLGKRVNFLNEVIAELGLAGCEAIHARAEEYGRKNRECFDIVTARAVAKLPELSEYCLPLCKKGGIFAAMKGQKPGEEADSARIAINLLGGKLRDIKEFTLPGEMERSIIIIDKVKPTPPQYPRPSAKIAKVKL